MLRNAKHIELGSLPVFFSRYLLARMSWMVLLKNVEPKVRDELYYSRSQSDNLESLVDLPFLAGLLELVSVTGKVQGNIIELGTYKGGTTISIAHYLQLISSNKRVYACDTFAGHPYGEAYKGWKARAHFSDTSVEYVQRKCESFGVADRIQLVQGRFEESLDCTLAHEMFSLAFIDCDLYQSAKYSLAWLTSRIAKGGVIAMHDYFGMGSGIPKAAHEWCRSKGLRVNLCPIPHISI